MLNLLVPIPITEGLMVFVPMELLLFAEESNDAGLLVMLNSGLFCKLYKRCKFRQVSLTFSGGLPSCRSGEAKQNDGYAALQASLRKS